MRCNDGAQVLWDGETEDYFYPGEFLKVQKRGNQMAGRIVDFVQFVRAMAAVWSEIRYQNELDWRTEDEAKSPADFATLGHRYLRKLEDDWSDNAGIEKSLPNLRKLSAIFVRGMIYNGVRFRVGFEPSTITVNSNGAEIEYNHSF
jgi:hypothetical protein